jgi:hypothetical protein
LVAGLSQQNEPADTLLLLSISLPNLFCGSSLLERMIRKEILGNEMLLSLAGTLQVLLNCFPLDFPVQWLRSTDSEILRWRLTSEPWVVLRALTPLRGTQVVWWEGNRESNATRRPKS